MATARLLFYKPGKLLAGLAIPCLLALVWMAGSWGQADIHARPAMNRSGELRKPEFAGVERDSLMERLERAIDQNPGNPEYLQTYAVSTAAWNRRATAADNTANRVLEQSLQQLRQAAAMRPTWPFVHIEIALLKYRLRQIDEEFYKAFDNALTYGPAEPGILRTTISLSTQLWGMFPEPLRLRMLEAMRRSFRHTSTVRVKAMQKLIVQGGLAAQVCEVNGADEALAQFCDTQIPTR